MARVAHSSPMHTLGTLTLFRMYDRSVSCKCAHVGFQWSVGSLGVLVGCMVSAEAPPSRFYATRSRPGVVRECSRLSAGCRVSGPSCEASRRTLVIATARAGRSDWRCSVYLQCSLCVGKALDRHESRKQNGEREGQGGGAHTTLWGLIDVRGDYRENRIFRVRFMAQTTYTS